MFSVLRGGLHPLSSPFSPIVLPLGLELSPVLFIKGLCDNRNMQQGMKAGLAIALAVFLTGFVGFVTAVTPEDVERTYYTQISDLTPVMDYTAIESYTDYNPITNVTGWVDYAGMDIPFLEIGHTSAYPYRFYKSSNETTWTTNMIQTSGILDGSWSSFEDAIWYPVAGVYPLSTVPGSTTTHNGIEAERVSAGHITVESDATDSDTTSFSVNFAHMNGSNVIHEFTWTFVRSTSGPTLIEEDVTSLSDFDSRASSSRNILPPASNMGIAVSIDVNVSLPEGHWIRCSFTTTQDSQETGVQYHWICLYNGNITLGQQYDPINQYEVYNGGLSWRSVSDNVLNRYVEIRNDLAINGSTVNTYLDSYVYIPLTQFLRGATLEDETTFSSDWTFYHGSRSWRFEDDSDNLTNFRGISDVNVYSFPGRISYDKDTQKFYPATLAENGRYYIPDTNQSGYPLSEIYIMSKGFYGPYDTATIKSTTVEFSYKYVDPLEFVGIGNGITGKWHSYMDKTSGGQNIVEYYKNGYVQLLTEPGTVITTSDVFWSNTDGTKTQGTMSVTVPTSVPYSMALVTLDFQHGEYYAQGIVWGSVDAEDRNTDNWSLRPYRYDMSPMFMKEIGHVLTPTSDSPSYTESLSFAKSGGTKVFILNTSVQTDPQGKLWGDPNTWIGFYFPDYFNITAHNDHGVSTGTPKVALRMLFNGFVSYGDTFTINGQTMQVEDGQITFIYNNPEEGPKSATFPIKGMAVDWEDGKVYLVFTEQGKTRYDIGAYDETSMDVKIYNDNGVPTDKGVDTIAADVISGTGVWYWQAELYTINVGMETVYNLDLSQGLDGWGMSLQTSMLLFVGMLILGVALVFYFYRETEEPMSLIDWIIIGAAIFLSLGVALI